MRLTCLNMVHELARQDERILYIGSDPGAGTLRAMAEEFPRRHFIEGISEAHVVGMAAGLAMEGYVPFVNTIATFLTRRCLEQVALDVCLHSLPVRLIGNGGGAVYAPLGPTHTAVDDIALMRVLPGMTVVCPADAVEMRQMMEASPMVAGPLYIRLGKGGDPVITDPAARFDFGQAVEMRAPGPVLIVATGIMTGRALAAADALAAEGVGCGVFHMPTVKPLDLEGVRNRLAGVRLLVTIEEHSLVGGLSSAVLEGLTDALAPHPPVLRLGLPDAPLEGYGSQDDVLERWGLSVAALAPRIRNALASVSAPPHA